MTNDLGMTARDKVRRWPFLDEGKTIHVAASGERTVLDEPSLMPDRYTRLGITDDLPMGEYAQRPRKDPA